MKINFEKLNIKNFKLSKLKEIDIKMAVIGIGTVVILSIPIMMMNQGKDESKEVVKIEIDSAEISKAIEDKGLVKKLEGIYSPEWNIQQSKIAFAQGDRELGKELLSKVAEYDFLDSKNAKEIVLTYFFNGEAIESIVTGKKFIERYKDDLSIHKTMIMVYLYNGINGEADKLISELDTRVNHNIRLLEPIKEYEELSDTDISKKFSELAEMYYLIGNREESIINIEKAWYKDVDNYKIYDLLSKMAQDNMTETLKSISFREEEAQKLFNDKKIAQYNEKMYKLWFAKIYSMDSNTSQQSEHLLAGIEDEFEKSINFRRTRISTMFLNGKTEESIEELNKLLEENPGDFTVRYTASTIAYLTGDYEKSLEEALKTVELNPEYEDTYGILLPNIYNALGESEKVENLFRESVEKNPVSVSNINAMAAYYFNNNELEKSAYYYNIAKSLSPLNGEIRYKSAWTSIGLAKDAKYRLPEEEDISEEENEVVREYYKDALSAVKRSIELTSKEPVAKYYRMASILYMKLGESEEAYRYIKKAYALDEDDILTLNNAGIFHILMNDQIENDNRVYKGFYNLMKADEGLNGDFNPEIIEIISNNYEIAKNFWDEFKNADDNAVMELPNGFQLVY